MPRKKPMIVSYEVAEKVHGFLVVVAGSDSLSAKRILRASPKS
jgi:hypothetical protein